MQLNIYVPKEKAGVITALDRAVEMTGRPKNEIVLEALERYLPGTAPFLGKFSLGKVKNIERSTLYRENLSQ